MSACGSPSQQFASPEPVAVTPQPLTAAAGTGPAPQYYGAALLPM